MKSKCLFQILTIWVMFMMAKPATAQDVFYVYRNDHCINTFFTEDIDSIVYSNFDTDSVWHDDVVTQVIYESDTLYRIPLEIIDSVGFRTPQTEYQPGTVVLEGEIRKYIISRDSLTLVFDFMTPNELLPKVGDHLVSTVGDDVMPSAFIGKVSTISQGDNGIVVDCSICSLSDVFVRYYGVSRGEQAIEAPPRKAFSDGNWPYSFNIRPGKLSKNLFSTNGWITSFLPVDFLSFNFNDYHVTFSVIPDLKVRGYLIYDRYYDVNLGITITGTCDFSQEMRLAGSVSLQKDLRLWQRAWPIPEALVDITAEIGLFLQAEVELAIQRKLNQIYELGFHWEWSRSGRNMLKNGFVFRPVSHSEEGGATIKGDLHGGGYGQVGVAFIATDNLDIAEINFRFEGGVGMQGISTFTPENIRNRMTSTALYNELKDKEIETYWFYGTKVEGKLFKWSLSHDFPNILNIPFGKQGRIDSRYAVPLFSDTKLKQKGNTNLLAQTNASHRTYKEDIGFMLTNKDNPSETTPIYRIQGYSGPDSKLEYTFSNLNRGKYKVNPLVKFMGVEMLASPSADVELEIPVEITNFKVTRSEHKDNGFYHNGSYYDYAYYAATTVVLKESEGVADWGYVYEDPNGQPARISLKGYGSSHTDTRYAYYRNSAHDHACLYEYVQYEGDPEYYYGEKKTYNLDYEGEHSCPDDNHPHMIDLGLPSGIKWACCNVGASSPEEYGGYYAWGETEEKSEYCIRNYKYVVLDDNNGIWYDKGHYYLYQSIGSDISGTQYDVAHVKWGGDWHMPTLAQIQELLNNTTSEWTSENGVAGIKFMGSNGGSIFLPAAGVRWDSGHNHVGNYGLYWSSTLHEYYEGGAYDANYLFFGSDYSVNWFYDYRYYGRSVRPVR